MNPTTFPEANKHLLPPPGVSEKECGTLDVFSDGKYCISLWKPTWKERLSILFKGKVWLWIWSGRTQPPVCIDTVHPFVKPVRSSKLTAKEIPLQEGNNFCP